MALSAWPIATYRPGPDSFQPIHRMRDPLETAMEGGNTRSRPRPGDNVGTITQTIWVTAAEHDTFVAWVKAMLGNGTAQFITDVWLGTSYLSKVCQFIKPGSNLKYAWIGVDRVAVTMTLRACDVCAMPGVRTYEEISAPQFIGLHESRAIFPKCQRSIRRKRRR
jgi:hypothetical protein